MNQAQEVSASCDGPGTLFIRTRELLLDEQRSLIEISEQSGIPFYWLKSFRRGESVGPSVNRVQHLYEFLTGSALRV